MIPPPSVLLLLLAAQCAHAQGDWEQRLATAIYQHAAVSSSGYAAAGTSLTQPLEAELFEVFSGNQSFVSVAETNPQDHGTIFDVDIAREGTTAVAIQSSRGNFSSYLFKFDAAGGKLDWQDTFNKTELMAVKTSNDGSVIAVIGFGNMSFYEPPNLALWLYDGASGKEREDAFISMPSNTVTKSGLSLSGDGSYVAFTTSELVGTGRATKIMEYVHVVELSSGKKHRHEMEDWGSLESSADRYTAISTDGVWLACGASSDVYIYKRTGKGDSMTYDFYTVAGITPGTEDFFLNGGTSGAALNFGGGTDGSGMSVLAAGWMNVFHARNGVAVTAWLLDEAAPNGTAPGLLVNYSLPLDDDVRKQHPLPTHGVDQTPPSPPLACL